MISQNPPNRPRRPARATLAIQGEPELTASDLAGYQKSKSGAKGTRIPDPLVAKQARSRGLRALTGNARSGASLHRNCERSGEAQATCDLPNPSQLIRVGQYISDNVRLGHADAARDRSLPAALGDDRHPTRHSCASDIHEELKCDPAETRALSQLTPGPMVFVKEFTYNAQLAPLSLAEISCCTYWVRNETEQKCYVDPVPIWILPTWDLYSSHFHKYRSKKRRT